MVVHLPKFGSQCEEPCKNYKNQKWHCRSPGHLNARFHHSDATRDAHVIDSIVCTQNKENSCQNSTPDGGTWFQLLSALGSLSLLDLAPNIRGGCSAGSGQDVTSLLCDRGWKLGLCHSPHIAKERIGRAWSVMSLWRRMCHSLPHTLVPHCLQLLLLLPLCSFTQPPLATPENVALSPSTIPKHLAKASGVAATNREVLNGVGADGVRVKFPIFPVNCSYLSLVLG